MTNRFLLFGSTLLLVSLLTVEPSLAKTKNTTPADSAFTGEPENSPSQPSVAPAASTNAPPVKPQEAETPPPPLKVPTPMLRTNAAPFLTLPPIPAMVTPATPPPPAKVNQVASLKTSDLREYEMQSPAVKALISRALDLTTLDLAYHYGSSDPKSGGMDCSGTIYYLLNESGLADVPRDASEMYKWVWTESRFQAVTSSNPHTFELGPLKPGDLLFWTGTYQIDRDPPVTHVMIYLGINRHTNQRVMMGASEGRRFEGKSMNGVSVFDFTLPGKKPAAETENGAPKATESQARFIGYGSVPRLENPPPQTASNSVPTPDDHKN